MHNSIIGITLAIFSTISWALCSVIFKKLGKKLDSIGMATITAIVSSIVLFILTFLTHSNINIPINDFTLIALSGILGIAVGDSLFYASLARISPFVISIILFATPSVFSGIFGFVFLNEIPSKLSLLGIFFILSGVAFLVFPPEKNMNSAQTKISGVIFAFLSLACTTYSSVMVKPVLAHYSTLSVTMYRMFFGAIFLLIISFISKRIFNWKKSLSDIKYMLKLCATVTIASVGGFWLSLCAIKYCKLIIASSIMSIEPLFVLIFMILFYKYSPKAKEYLGIFITVFGIVLLCAR